MSDEKFEENSSPENEKFEAGNMPSDSVREAVSDGSSDSDFEQDDDAISRNEIRSENRRRKRLLESMAASMNMSDEETMRMVALIDELLPDQTRMSAARHVEERLDHGLAELRQRHPRLLFNRKTNGPLDISKAKRTFDDNADLASLPENEEDLFRAILVNDRMMFGYQQKVLEHEQSRALLIEEFVRRQTLYEQWRHLLPKYVIPVFAMFYAAGVKAKDLQIGSRLLNRIRDDVVEWSGGAVTASELMEAARSTEDEFMKLIPSSEDTGSAGSAGTAESFDECRQRLSFTLEEARLDVEELVAMEADQDEIAAAESKVRRLIMALGLDGGIDGNGRLVFSSVESFAERSRAVAPSRRNDMRTDMEEAKADPAPASDAGTVSSADEVEDTYENVPDVDAIDLPEDAGSDGDVGASDDPSESDFDASAPADSEEDDDGLEGDDDKGNDGDFGPDIPDDLFGTEPGVDPEDDIPGDSEDGDASPMEDGDTEAGTDEVSDDLPVEPVSIPPAPVGEEHTVFSPERLEDWPTTISDVQALVPSLPRSTGLSRSTGSDPFKMWTPLPDKTDFCFIGFRRHPDLSAREGIEGPIEPADLSRMEMGEGKWRGLIRDSFSPVLGPGHPLMLPPHSSLAWYGRKLGWSEADVRSLTAFGSPARPESITPKGDVKKLLDALRGVARLRMDELARSVNGHFLSDTQRGEERRKEASEDLARWWLFVLVARHRQAEFDMLLPGGFFHGVHGPDFVVDAEGKAYFGKTGNASHLGLWSIEMRRRIDQAGPKAKPEDLGIGEPYSGPRRMTA